MDKDQVEVVELLKKVKKMDLEIFQECIRNEVNEHYQFFVYKDCIFCGDQYLLRYNGRENIFISKYRYNNTTTIKNFEASPDLFVPFDNDYEVYKLSVSKPERKIFDPYFDKYNIFESVSLSEQWKIMKTIPDWTALREILKSHFEDDITFLDLLLELTPSHLINADIFDNCVLISKWIQKIKFNDVEYFLGSFYREPFDTEEIDLFKFNYKPLTCNGYVCSSLKPCQKSYCKYKNNKQWNYYVGLTYMEKKLRKIYILLSVKMVYSVKDVFITFFYLIWFDVMWTCLRDISNRLEMIRSKLNMKNVLISFTYDRVDKYFNFSLHCLKNIHIRYIRKRLYYDLNDCNSRATEMSKQYFLNEDLFWKTFFTN
ncbi:uncharacterized protein LOC124814262 isoform X2 [Hydra vulgaris]|uniref:uncharacterized protein LOC124814262 isoform X2 n=1 Tax=Hydra vulgaris TaxID=6087 RepID=UPI001F5F2990|nr:uncharacterized protein LOC124814262 isoform X2 [Hydra vulgaris]